jgi:hypothetical protein
VTITTVTLRDCSNNDITPTSSGPPANVTIDLTPVMVAAITDPQTVEEQSTLTVTPSATQSSCAPGTLVWSVSPALPSGATFNAGNGKISWTPACGDAGSYGPFTLKATAPSSDYWHQQRVRDRGEPQGRHGGGEPDHRSAGRGRRRDAHHHAVGEHDAVRRHAADLERGAGAAGRRQHQHRQRRDHLVAELLAGRHLWSVHADRHRGDQRIGNSNPFSIQVTNTPSAIGSPTGVSAAQVLTGNPSGQTTGIT